MHKDDELLVKHRTQSGRIKTRLHKEDELKYYTQRGRIKT